MAERTDRAGLPQATLVPSRRARISVIWMSVVVAAVIDDGSDDDDDVAHVVLILGKALRKGKWVRRAPLQAKRARDDGGLDLGRPGIQPATDCVAYLALELILGREPVATMNLYGIERRL